MDLTFEKYQQKANNTAVYPKGYLYASLGLCGEAGECANKIKKVIRDDNGELTEKKKK